MSKALHKCLIKSKFFSEDSAIWRCADINLEHGYEKFKVYKCKCCNFYHLTTQN